MMSRYCQPNAPRFNLPPQLHRTLKLKAAAADRSRSDLVSDAVSQSLAEDAEDLEAVRLRAREKPASYASFVSNLKRRGKL